MTAVLGYLEQRGITERTARTYRLGCVPQGEEYAGRLAIPYIAADGSVVDIRFRSINGENPKYISRQSSKVRLFGVSALLAPTTAIYLTEGEVDCMTLNQIGIPAVGVPGANSWQPHWKRLFDDYDVVIAVCDGDQAGRDFGKRVAEHIDGTLTVHLPEGEDINSLYVQYGEAVLRDKVGQ